MHTSKQAIGRCRKIAGLISTQLHRLPSFRKKWLILGKAIAIVYGNIRFYAKAFADDDLSNSTFRRAETQISGLKILQCQY
jgi:hypothetical protein